MSFFKLAFEGCLLGAFLVKVIQTTLALWYELAIELLKATPCVGHVEGIQQQRISHGMSMRSSTSKPHCIAFSKGTHMGESYGVIFLFDCQSRWWVFVFHFGCTYR